MNDYGYLFAVFLAMGAISFGERALPFVAASWLKRQRWVRVLGDFLPLAIMVLLTVSSTTDAALSHDAGPWYEIISIAFTVTMQWFFKNSLLSIFGGTVVYVVLRNGFLPF